MVTNYVDNKELKRVIEDGKLKPFRIRQILKKQGIILTSTNAEQIAEQVYPILWGTDDIEKMSQSIEDGGNYLKSSVFVLTNPDVNNIMDDTEDFFSNISFRESKYSLMAIVRDGDNILVKLRYALSRPGRNAFISTQYKETEIKINKMSKCEVLVDVRQASSSEMKDFNRVLESQNKKYSSFSAKHISLQVLTNENRVAFFDEFVKKKFAGWRFETVTKIELKKYEGTDDEETKELDGEEEETLKNLQGITSAILNGTSIRNNSFVQECLDNNFYVSTMGYKFESMADLRAVVVEINFKYDDLKIDICKTYEYDSDVEDLRLHPSEYSVQEAILSMFQKGAYEKYSEILERQKKEALEIKLS